MIKKFITICTLLVLGIFLNVTQVMAGFADLENSNPLTQAFFKSSSDHPENDINNFSFTFVYGELYKSLIGTAYKLISGLAVLYLLYSGLQYLMSGGSPEKIKKARTAMIQSMLGIVLMVSMFTILAVIWSIVATISANV